MLTWIYDEFIQDSTKHPNIFPPSAGSERLTEDFITRNTSRTVSYVNHVCSLEYVFVRLYRETITKLQAIDPTISIDETALAARKEEVSNCFTFRNKVSAHTAYGFPIKEDNLAMQFHSLVALLSSSYDSSGSADSFALEAPSVTLAGQTPNRELPSIGLKALHQKISQHIELWTKMLLDPCSAARQKLPLTIGDTEYRAD